MLALESFYDQWDQIKHDKRETMIVAQNLTDGCWYTYMKTRSGLGPEEVRIYPYSSLPSNINYKISNPGFFLRPEFVESLFVLYRLTGDQKYQEMAWSVFRSIQNYCKLDIGYGGLQDVNDPKSVFDEMPSFFVAETLKYLLLTFAPENYIDIREFTFNTEAHPLRQIKVSNENHTSCHSHSFDTFQPVSPILVLASNVIFMLTTVWFISLVYSKIEKTKFNEVKKNM